jgi:hypothetical protein
MLHDNWTEYFMVWIQICIVIYICNEMHKTLHSVFELLKQQMCRVTNYVDIVFIMLNIVIWIWKLTFQF